MALILFRRLTTATPTSTIAPYVALNEYWDDVKRIAYRNQETSPVDDPSEVALNTELARYAVRAGVARVVRYGGNGQIYTVDETQAGGPAGGGVCTLAAPAITPNPAVATNAGTNNGTVEVTCSLGVPPYALALRYQRQAPVLATTTSASQQQPGRFNNLFPGRYEVTVTDAVGCVRTALFDVYAGATGNGPYGPDLRVSFSVANGLYRYFWNPITKDVETFTRPAVAGDGVDDYDNPTPYGTPVDGYLLADGYTWRAVYSNGQGGVYFTDTDTRKPGLLELNNLIIFHPDRPQDATGGVLVEVNATDPPLTFQLNDGAGLPVGPANATGHFDGLAQGRYEVVVTDAERRTLAVPFSLRARYAPRWELAADNLDGELWSAQIWQLGYSGAVEAICGEGSAPVRLRSDGLTTALGGQGDVPACIGSSCELRLLATLEQLAAIQLGTDREFRLDVYRAGVLDFRGYVTPDVYTAELLDGLVPVGITATDGLATLRDTVFAGHVGQLLAGRWPVLNTLLHCLSRCDVALPLRIATNRRPAELPTVTAPERGLLSERAGYAEKGEPLDMRAVVEACAQLLGGTLVQRGGQWEIRAEVEAANTTVPARLYATAGTSGTALAVAAPSGTVRPSREVRAAGAGWFWLGGAQALSIRAGWKSLTAKTDVDYATNALPAGDVFGSDAAWNLPLDALLPTAGWSENAAAPGFPLRLERAGEKNSDLGTAWPRSQGAIDGRYLQSGQLPNRPQTEDVPWSLKITGRLVIPDEPGHPAPVLVPGDTTATLRAEVIVDGQPPLLPLVFSFVLPGTADTVTILPLGPLPAGAKIVRLRLFPWEGPALRTARAVLLIKQVAVVLTPQGASWDGKDTFRADSGGGTVRPTEPLAVFHADVPAKAGLFEANAFAFRRAVSVLGGALTTTWQRPGDVAAAPLLESAALDVLSLRASPSRLIKGVLRYVGTPPRLLDTVDVPNDLSGRRFQVVAVADDVRANEAEVSVVEVGVGAALVPPSPLDGYPAGVRLLDGVVFLPGDPVTAGGGRQRARATHAGLRTTHHA